VSINLDEFLGPKEDLSRQILSNLLVLNPRAYELIGQAEMAIVEGDEGVRLVCGSLDEFGIVRPVCP
jgi:hypothetical protein